MGLCYLQPLVRSWQRYRTRLFGYRPPLATSGTSCEQGLSLAGTRTVDYWSETGHGRLQLLGLVVLHLNEHRWGRTIDSGWSDWDLEVYCHPWTVVQICTVQEDHGGGQQLIRVRYRLRASGSLKALGVLAVLAGAAGAQVHSGLAAAGAAVVLACCLGLWWLGTRRAARALAVIDRWAAELGMIRCPAKQPREGPETPG
jgi:hypothetical protein